MESTSSAFTVVATNSHASNTGRYDNSVRVRQGIGVRASENRIQAKRAGFLDHLWTFGAGVDPKFLAALLRNVVEHFHTDLRRQVDANAVKRDRDVEDGFVA